MFIVCVRQNRPPKKMNGYDVRHQRKVSHPKARDEERVSPLKLSETQIYGRQLNGGSITRAAAP
jgi:hypothetical protein